MEYNVIIQSTLDIIDRRITENIRVDELARKANYSVYHFCRVFAEATGMPPSVYITRRKLEHALYALSKGKRIIDVAADFGFETHAGFTKAVKRYYGHPPSMYRNQNLHMPTAVTLINKGGTTMRITLEERIFGLSKIWREAKYNFAYWEERPEVNWDKAYQEALAQVVKIEDPYEYYRELQKFISLLRDGRSYVVMPEALTGNRTAPFGTDFVEGRHVVSRVPKGCSVALFSEILAVNDIPLAQYLAQHVTPYIWHEKEDSVFSQGQLHLAISQREKGRVTIHTTGGHFSYDEGAAFDWHKDMEHCKEVSHPSGMAMRKVLDTEALILKITEDNIGYIYMKDFLHEDFQELLWSNVHLIKDCAGFIIDMTDNPGGMTDLSLPMLFFKEKFKHDISISPIHFALFANAHDDDKLYEFDEENEEYRAMVSNIEYIGRRGFYNPIQEGTEYNGYIYVDKDCPIHLTQPVVVLANSNTQGVAEDFLIYMQYENRATIVGTPSYGACGQAPYWTLPGGGHFRICTIKWFDPTGKLLANVGIEPDVFAAPTIQSKVDGFDAVFEKGLAVLREKINSEKQKQHK
jgi:AraC-like DNA-binding protein